MYLIISLTHQCFYLTHSILSVSYLLIFKAKQFQHWMNEWMHQQNLADISAVSADKKS